MSRDMQALLLLVLAVTFYLLAAAAGVGLVYAAYWYLRVGFLHVTVVLGLGGAALLYALVPWPEEYVPPSMPVEAADHPRLFEEIASLAAALHVRPPVDVYLEWEPVAWVQDRGGVLGFGGRRVMVLGYPLLCVLTRSELRAVIAHELGHFHGDTRLAGVVHRVHAAMARSVESLEGSSSGGFVLAIPFHVYAVLFMRFACGVSRARETAADAHAARIAGSRATARALERTHDAALALPSYWQRLASPVLTAGWLPGLGPGFAAFLDGPRIAARVKAGRQATKQRPYDTHPPLEERLRAIEALAEEALESDRASGASLLDQPGEVERRLVATRLPVERADRLRPASWAEALADVYPARFRAIVKENERPLARFTVARLHELANAPESFETQPVVRGGYIVPPAEVPDLARVAVGAALALPLLERGYRLRASPAGDVVLSRDSRELEPFEVLPRLQSGELQPDELLALAAAEGLGEADLATLCRTGDLA